MTTRPNVAHDAFIYKAVGVFFLREEWGAFSCIALRRIPGSAWARARI